MTVVSSTSRVGKAPPAVTPAPRERSGLEGRELMLVRLTALVASYAPQVSDVRNLLGTPAEAGLEAEAPRARRPDTA